jgi:hypothetical protein
MNRTLALVALLASLAFASTTAAAGAAVKARGSVEQVHVTGAKKGTRLTLVDRRGHVVASQRAGSLGGAVFRDVKPGAGYRVGTSRAFKVLSDRSAPPSTKLYRRKIQRTGYGYLVMRDGTKLATAVHLPAGAGPYPTLIEDSGYGYANPAGGES